MFRWARRFVREHPVATGALVASGLGLLIFGIVWFEPHKLFIDERVDESLPGAPMATVLPSPDAVPESAAVDRPAVLAAGRFGSLEHESSGVAKLVELADGLRVLRFENLSTSNGPDLRVYLSEIPASDDWHAYGVRFVDLGGLKGNQGNQNYRIPENADLSKIRSAVIWCRRFEVGFAVAPLDLG